MSGSKSPQKDQPLGKVDPDMPEFARRIGVSLRAAYKIAHRGEVQTYLLAGRRRIRDSSIERYIEVAVQKGPQFQPPPTGKRPKGRPRKDQQPTAAAE
jgi:hypothetical protein